MAVKIITCVLGDITKSDAEAIVNAANNYLWMGSGVAGAIKKAGGAEIEREAIKLGPIEIGEAVATSAGKLRQKYVIHAAAMGQDLITDESKIKNATFNALRCAEELGITSIDFPALGTGVGGFSSDMAARVMILIAREFLKTSKYVIKVGFILFDSFTFTCFKLILGGERLLL
jgi:O-acetyl-ADP-ribose deacetylase (regulator of RNase III)